MANEFNLDNIDEYLSFELILGSNNVKYIWYSIYILNHKLRSNANLKTNYISV